MNLVVVGHVDHGKSTIVGRLLADTGSLPDGKLEQVRTKCEQNGKQFEYAFLLDALSDEQAQGITIDAARIFFQTDKRHYIIIDAPGHIEFLKNMITGASHAEAALLVIDAQEGIRENSRRHGFMLSLLGVKSVIVLVNKMDLVGFAEEAFLAIRTEYEAFLQSVGIKPLAFIPVSGMAGDNIAESSTRMPWYPGEPVLTALDSLRSAEQPDEKQLRFYVQDVYKFTKFDDQRRIIAATIDSGTMRVGDEVAFYPSGKKSRIASFECFNVPNKIAAGAGEAVAFTLEEQIYVVRGELAAHAAAARPKVTTRLNVSLFWLGREPMLKNAEYVLKVGTARVQARIEHISKVVDASTLEIKHDAKRIERNEVAECVLKLNKAVSFDEVDEGVRTSRFVIVDAHRISGGGIIREALEDRQSKLREQALLRDSKWIDSTIDIGRRAEKYNQKPTLLLITGRRETDRKALARALEARLFSEGKLVYFIGIGNLLHGLDADIDGKEGSGPEHIRRLAEVAHLMLHAGIIFIVSAVGLNQDDVGTISALVGEENIRTVVFGPEVPADLECELHLPDENDLDDAVERIKELLYSGNVIFRPW